VILKLGKRGLMKRLLGQDFVGLKRSTRTKLEINKLPTYNFCLRKQKKPTLFTCILPSTFLTFAALQQASKTRFKTTIK